MGNQKRIGLILTYIVVSLDFCHGGEGVVLKAKRSREK